MYRAMGRRECVQINEYERMCREQWVGENVYRAMGRRMCTEQWVRENV